jgi:Asp-tRNA(Asn)/Glu-tRNA(Gln) amidotransferase A subunit family amidase
MENIFINNSIAEIHKKLINKEIRSSDIAQICIAKYEEYQNQYFPWASFNNDLISISKKFEETQNRIEKGVDLRSLDGIPVGIKDIFNTLEFPTQMGSPLWKGFTPGNDARVVYNLKENGAIVPGKTVTAEFAVHTLNETLNPHDITKTPGTSSSGSAVAISLGMVPVAMGTQTAGSIVRPASFCGIYGCKPSFGLIPRTAMLKTTDSLDTIGYFTSKYEDLIRVFEAVRVHGLNYPISNAVFQTPSRIRKPSNRPWKVGFVKTHTWKFAYDYAKDSILDWIKKLAANTDVEIFEVDLPSQMKRTHEIHAIIYDKTLSYYFAEEYKKAELVSPIMNSLIKHGNEITPAEYHKAVSDQTELCQEMDEFLCDYDVIVSLSTAGEAPLRDVVEAPDPALMWTMTHLPVVSAPVFVSPLGLPFGLQFASRRYNDYLLFNFLDYLRNLDLIPSGTYPLCKKE